MTYFCRVTAEVLPVVRSQTEIPSSTRSPSPPGSRHVTAVLAYRSSLVSPNTGDGSSTGDTNNYSNNIIANKD